MPHNPGLMIALIQRVSQAEVRVSGEVVGAIGRGVLALIACNARTRTPRHSGCSSGCCPTASFPTSRAGWVSRCARSAQACCWCRSSRWPPTPTRHPRRVQPCCRARGGTAPVRLPRGARAQRLCPCFGWRIWRRHAGGARQRRPGDVLARDPLGRGRDMGSGIERTSGVPGAHLTYHRIHFSARAESYVESRAWVV